MAEDTHIQNRSNENEETIASRGEADLEKELLARQRIQTQGRKISEHQREAEAALVFGKG